ncbi:MAG: ROK family protein [Elusimicrobiaceae bacterium]|nr:ROK family protein [Elusimicrobiaceae bacterium]
MIGIGVDAGGTFIKFVAVGDNCRVLDRAQAHTPATGGEFVGVISERILQWKRELGGRLCAAMGFAGAVDFERGVVHKAPNIPCIENLNIAEQVKKRTGIPCVLDNDANMAAWGAYAYDLKEKYPTVITVTLGTGVGGGLVLDGELFRGATGAAAEIGHMNIEPGGRRCPCGGRGCLEAYCGKHGIIARARSAYAAAGKKIPDGIDPLWLAEAAESGDKAALELWRKTGEYLGYGLGNACVLLSPDAIVFTGGLSGAKKFFMPAVEKVFADWAMDTAFRHVKLKVSRFPNLGSMGAALYARHCCRK